MSQLKELLQDAELEKNDALEKLKNLDTQKIKQL